MEAARGGGSSCFSLRIATEEYSCTTKPPRLSSHWLSISIQLLAMRDGLIYLHAAGLDCPQLILQHSTPTAYNDIDDHGILSFLSKDSNFSSLAHHYGMLVSQLRLQVSCASAWTFILILYLHSCCSECLPLLSSPQRLVFLVSSSSLTGEIACGYLLLSSVASAVQL